MSRTVHYADGAAPYSPVCGAGKNVYGTVLPATNHLPIVTCDRCKRVKNWRAKR